MINTNTRGMVVILLLLALFGGTAFAESASTCSSGTILLDGPHYIELVNTPPENVSATVTGRNLGQGCQLEASVHVLYEFRGSTNSEWKVLQPVSMEGTQDATFTLAVSIPEGAYKVTHTFRIVLQTTNAINILEKRIVWTDISVDPEIPPDIREVVYLNYLTT